MAVEHKEILRHRSFVSWGAVFAGAFVALAIQVALTLLGIAVGVIGSATPQNPLVNYSTGIEIWLVISTMISLYCGGYVAGRLSGYARNLIGSLHGLIVWGLVTAFSLSLYLISSTVGLLFSGVNGVVMSGMLLLHNGISGVSALSAAQVADIVPSAAIAAFVGMVLNLIVSGLGGITGVYRVIPVAVAIEEIKAEEKREFPKAA